VGPPGEPGNLGNSGSPVNFLPMFY
jgi:hypothetical protein